MEAFTEGPGSPSIGVGMLWGCYQSSLWKLGFENWYKNHWTVSTGLNCGHVFSCLTLKGSASSSRWALHDAKPCCLSCLQMSHGILWLIDRPDVTLQRIQKLRVAAQTPWRSACVMEERNQDSVLGIPEVKSWPFQIWPAGSYSTSGSLFICKGGITVSTFLGSCAIFIF